MAHGKETKMIDKLSDAIRKHEDDIENLRIRLRAAEAGEQKYFGGPCLHNHQPPVRYVSTGACWWCMQVDRKKEWRAKNKSRVTSQL